MSKTLRLKYIEIIKLYIFVIQILASNAVPSFFPQKHVLPQDSPI